MLNFYCKSDGIFYFIEYLTETTSKKITLKGDVLSYIFGYT